jgi:hypothetical protein
LAGFVKVGGNPLVATVNGRHPEQETVNGRCVHT